MPQLEPEEYAEFSRMVDELEPEVSKMKEVPQSFMTDMVDKKKQFGERMFVSPKQKAWVERLHNEFVGTAEPQGARALDEGDGPFGQIPKGDPRFDDDIPF